jgi:hypothetical protein
MDPVTTGMSEYQPPALRVIGSVAALTQTSYCDKTTGGSDGFTFQAVAIVCASPR